MIGGNQYGEDRITKELFIRWLQASTFMPSLQFSWAPWNFDEETVRISRKFTKLHEEYAPYIVERFKLAMDKGEPVNVPVWWIDEDDEEAQVIDDRKKLCLINDFKLIFRIIIISQNTFLAIRSS